MNKLVFRAVIFKAIEEYLELFFQSLIDQNDKNFDIVIFNDGVLNPLKYVKSELINLDFVNISNLSIAEIRFKMLEYCKISNYNSVVWGDADDFFDNNRINIVKKYLKKYDLVANDLILVDQKGTRMSEPYFSERIANDTIIGFSDIVKKNIFGFTNTSFNLNLLKDFEVFNLDVIAVDWFIFTIMLHKCKKAIFTNETISYYRQHPNSLVGLSDISNNKVKKEFEVSVIKKHLIAIENYFELQLSSEINDIQLIGNLSNTFWWEHK